MFCIGMFLRTENCEVGYVYIQVNEVSFFILLQFYEEVFNMYSVYLYLQQIQIHDTFQANGLIV